MGDRGANSTGTPMVMAEARKALKTLGEGNLGHRLAVVVMAVLAGLSLSSVARAECADVARAIQDMDAKSVKPPGYIAMRTELARFAATCSLPPPRPEVTAEVARNCASSENPSICMLTASAAAACSAPQDAQQEYLCVMLFGEGNASARMAYAGGAVPPPLPLTIDGRSYRLPGACLNAARALSDNADTPYSAADLAGMRAVCPDFIDALERRVGFDAAQNAAAFWLAAGQLVQNNFAPPGTAPASAAATVADPNFRRMCQVAETNRNECRARQGRMGEVGTTSRSTSLQAGDFNDCARVYNGVLNMCGRTERQAAAVPLRSLKAPSPTTPAPTTRAPTVDVTAPRTPGSTVTPGTPRTLAPTVNTAPPVTSSPTIPRSAAVNSLSTQCKAQLNTMLEAADRRDGAKATAAYESMRANCDASVRGLAQEADVGLPERQMGSLSRRYFVECPSNANCTTAPSTPDQTARAAANAFNVDEVLNFAFSAAGFAFGVAGMYAPVSGGAIYGSTQFTTINQRARSTYGQGAPTHVAPRTVPSDITGTRR